MKMNRFGKMSAAVLLALAVLLAAAPVSAASGKQKKLAACVDPFVHSVLDASRAEAPMGSSSKKVKAAVKKIYSGKLTAGHKSLIAAMNTGGYKNVAGRDFAVYTSLSKVKKKYTKIFGTAKPKILLPAVASPADEGEYEMSFAMQGKKVYRLLYDTESDITIRNLSVKKSGSKYIVTRQYKYYAYWGLKAQGKKPSVTVKAVITMKRNKKSAYGYKITGLKIK